MASKVDIINRALTKLNAKRITSINDGTKNASDAAAVYDGILDEVLASFPWNFATRRVSLARLAAAPEYQYDFQFRIPSQPKVMHIWEAVSDNETRTKSYVIEGDDEGQLLLTNFNAIDIKYTALIIDTERFSPWMTESFATRLAAELAYPITGKQKNTERLMNEYGFKIQIAGMKEGQQGEDYVADDSKHPLEDDWVGIRQGGEGRIIGE